MINKIAKLLFASSFGLLLGINPSFAQEETVTVDTLVTIDDNGNELVKIIKKRTVRFENEGKVDGEKKVLRRKKIFIGEGESGENELILRRSGGEIEDTDIEIVTMGGNESMIWVDSDEDFLLGDMDSTVFKKEVQSKKLAASIAEESDADIKASLVEELDALLDEIFDLKSENMQKAIQTKAEKLENDRATLKKRRSSKAEMIKERKAELMKAKEEKPRW